MKKGFTLVELLAVIALLSIIIMIAVPSVLKLRQNAIEEERKNQIKEIEAAAVFYAQDNKDKNAVTVNELLEEGYMKATESNSDACDSLTYEFGCVIDPLNGNILNSKSISITRTNGKTSVIYNN